MNTPCLRSQTDSLNILWNANSEPDMYQYKLYRSVGNTTNFNLLQSIPHPQTHTVDRDNITPGTLLAYRLAAVDSAGNMSPFSDIVAVGIPAVIFNRSSVPAGETTTVPLSEAVSDPDNPLSDLQVSASDVSHLQVVMSGSDLLLTPSPTGYTGPAQFRLRVQDPDGFWDQKLLQLTVSDNSQPVFTLQIPPIVFPEDQQFTLWLDTCVTISNYSPQELSWQFLGLDHLTADYQSSTRKVTFSSIRANWFGADSLTIRATAPDQSSSSQDVVAQVSPVNDPPVLTITELFTSAISSNVFDLRQYASDPDNPPGQLTWQFIGYSHFQFVWQDESNKIVKIVSLDNTPSEEGVFVVTDPAGAADSAVVTIHYSSSSTNTPPRLSLPAVFRFAEDSLLTVPVNSYVVDSTNALSELVWQFTPGAHLHYRFDTASASLTLTADPDWWGESSLTVKVSDPDGLSDQKTVPVHVQPRTDLADMNIVSLSDGRAEVRITADVPSIVEMSYWSDPAITHSYRSPDYALKHDFYLSGLQPDVSYSYVLVLQDTSGFRVTAADSAFTYIPGGEPNAGDKVIVYPNPYRPSGGHTFVVFDHLPQEAARISIYTPAGELVYRADLQGNQTRRWKWAVVNDREQPLASGFYIYVIRDEKGKKIHSGKVAVLR